jgi:hypothetical protein
MGVLQYTKTEIGKENKLVRKLNARLNDDVTTSLHPTEASDKGNMELIFPYSVI